MSLANRVTTEDECAYLEAHGWRSSSLESLGPYRGHWVHPKLLNNTTEKCHYGPDEALGLTEKLGLTQ